MSYQTDMLTKFFIILLGGLTLGILGYLLIIMVSSEAAKIKNALSFAISLIDFKTLLN